uniref:Myb-like, SWIRM and MPN domain-containing protein 1 n=1 Tax=Iconisemion striatum TaxID=60296 RepID=A0A1A7WZ65_9TELE
MEDEVDVDIEGDDFDCNVREMSEGGVIQDQFVQSAGKSSSWILPWELDSSISPENREVIERMLLEEQYYLTGKAIPDNILHSDSNKKPKVKKSPSKNSTSTFASSSRWSKREKERFEEGLAQFGRRWTKIAKLVGTRNVLQVKNYARQHFKQKDKSEPKAAASSAGPELHTHPPPPAPGCASVLSNAVRIERLSDDEDVDITDDQSEDEGRDVQTGFCEPEEPKEEPTESDLSEGENVDETEDQPCQSSLTLQSPQGFSDLVCIDEDENLRINEVIKTEIPPEETAETNGGQSSLCDVQLDEYDHTCTDSVDKTENDEPEKEQEEEYEDEEEEELKAPEREIEMDTETITEDEKQAIPEFFEGRPSKTPERYLKIRNYILDQWYHKHTPSTEVTVLKNKPKYLNKTSVRPGLKNCGDVNCIGRIHTYLELIGAINFNCEQAVYNRPKVVDRSKHKEGKDVLEAYQLAQRLQSMRTRKRRVRDIWGNWCDAKDLEGQTYEHLSAKELALRREEMRKHPKPCKMSKYRWSLDPFQLIPCRSFEDDVQEPFQVVVCAETLLIMDMHAHVSRGEIIGLLGGTFSEEAKVLKICAAEPCNSVSTGLQCEMDPVSQTQACDMLASLGLGVVGWYHSHPSFQPNPSVRDINTQDQFQSYFSRGGAPFIGVIVSPYDPANPSPHSQITCLLVKESQEASSPNKLPYRFSFLTSQDVPDWDQTMRRAQWIVQKYAQAPGSVQMDRLFRRDSNLTCLEKMLASLARYMEPLPDGEGDLFLTQIQSLFLSDFIFKQQFSDLEERKPLDISSKTVESEDIPFDQLICQDGPQEEGGGVSEADSSSMLHLGSVLSTEHDYLL